MERRQFIKSNLKLGLHLGISYSVLSSALGRELRAQTGARVEDLVRDLMGTKALVLTPKSSSYAQYLSSYNIRTNLKPMVRVVVSGADEVARTLKWAQNNSVDFASRGGGHSYEGLSSSLGLVIDGRGLRKLSYDPSSKIIETGAGNNLGAVYDRISGLGQVLPAGSCRTVGVSGHVLGGGLGLLARPFGLASDSLLQARMVTADGKELICNEQENSDLFWALRGGGQGSLGFATEFQFQTQSLKQVSVYKLQFDLKADQAAKLMGRWQNWLITAPKEIMSILTAYRSAPGNIHVEIKGQSVGSEAGLTKSLSELAGPFGTAIFFNKRLSIKDAIQHYAGKDPKPLFMKAKSDVVTNPITAEGLGVLMDSMMSISSGSFMIICDSYGGAIAAKPNDHSAFPHRAALYGIQWASFWESAPATDQRLQKMTNAFLKMRTYMTGASYINYPDIELKDYARAYWQQNLERLIEVKKQYDPANFFKHAQSVPLKI